MAAFSARRFRPQRATAENKPSALAQNIMAGVSRPIRRHTPSGSRLRRAVPLRAQWLRGLSNSSPFHITTDPTRIHTLPSLVATQTPRGRSVDFVPPSHTDQPGTLFPGERARQEQTGGGWMGDASEGYSVCQRLAPAGIIPAVGGLASLGARMGTGAHLADMLRNFP